MRTLLALTLHHTLLLEEACDDYCSVADPRARAKVTLAVDDDGEFYPLVTFWKPTRKKVEIQFRQAVKLRGTWREWVEDVQLTVGQEDPTGTDVVVMIQAEGQALEQVCTTLQLEEFVTFAFEGTNFDGIGSGDETFYDLQAA